MAAESEEATSVAPRPAIPFISKRRAGDSRLDSLSEAILSFWLISFILSCPYPGIKSVHFHTDKASVAWNFMLNPLHWHLYGGGLSLSSPPSSPSPPRL